MSALTHPKQRWWIAATTATALVFVIAICFYAAQRAATSSERGTDSKRPGPRETANNRPAGFQEMAREAGITFRMSFLSNEQGENFKINLYDHGAGVAVADFDGDGHDDIYFLNQSGNNALYRNKGDGTFEDVTARARVALGDRVCTAAAFADTRNKGLQDLFVCSTRGGNVFFRNQGDGTFKEETAKAGLTHVGHSQAAVFFDFDNDGYLDLLVTNTARWTSETLDKARRYYPGKGILKDFYSSPGEDIILYRNNRDGTFTDATAKSGLKGRKWSGDVAVFDFNGDGYLDLFITNMFGPSHLYRNNGDGTFTDVTRKTLGATSYGGMGAKAFDFNNDGKLDLLLVDMHSDMWMGLDRDGSSLDRAKRWEKKKPPYLHGPETSDLNPAELLALDNEYAKLGGYRREDVVYGNTFYKNLGEGKFEEMSDRAGLETFWPWGIAAGDFDNDGYVDVFIPSGMGYPFYYWSNQLLMNNGNETFTNRADETGIEPPVGGIFQDKAIAGRPAVRSSRSAATADFDGDGRLDLIVNNFNDAPYYFRNTFPRKSWIAFRLRGTKSNRDAIGALVKIFIRADDGKQEIMVRQVDPAGGYLSQSSKTVHFGLGNRPGVDRVEIQWPSGRRQEIKNPTLNRRLDVVEE